MRLDFNILWVEDQPAEVKAQRDRIDFLLRKEGFRVHAEFATSVEQAAGFLGNDIFGDHVDLVLMDYDLGEGPNGSVGIEMVRERFPFKDIVFYSASGVQKLQESVAEGKTQGVFYSSRLELPDTVFGVFQALVKKVLDIEHSRGIVMGATSEIDYLVNESLVAAFSQGDEESRKAAVAVIAKQLADIRKTFEKEAKKVEEATELSALLGLHHVYSSVHRLRLLRKLLESAGTHEEERTGMVSYEHVTIPRRNELAHVRVERKGFSRKLYDRNGLELTAEDMRQLRVALLEHHELFEKVTASLKGAQPEGA
jgi:CheY-like chemotaxis protein